MSMRDENRRTSQRLSADRREGAAPRRSASNAPRSEGSTRRLSNASQRGGRASQRPASRAQDGISFSTNRRQQLGSVCLETTGNPKISSNKGRSDGESKGFFGGLFGAIISLIARSKVLLVLCILVVVIGVGSVVDNVVNGKKIYDGVFVGDVDLSGLTVEEAEALITENYAESLQATRVVIFADEAASRGDVDEMLDQQNAVAEQLSVEEARENTKVWVATSDSLSATVPAYDLATAAFEIGRDDGGILKRFHAYFFDYRIEPYAAYDDDAVEVLANDIDLTLGKPRVDYDIEILEGVASVVGGHDGDMLNREDFISRLNAAFMGQTTGDVSFIAETEYAPLRIDAEQAQEACDFVNGLISCGVTFQYGECTWTAEPADIGSWIQTEVVPVKKRYELNIFIDPSAVKPQLLTNMHQALTGYDIVVDFEEKGGQIVVKTDGVSAFPHLDGAIALLDGTMFSSYRDDKGIEYEEIDPKMTIGSIAVSENGDKIVTIGDGVAPTEMTIDEARELGIISTFSSFTTEYTSTSSTQNRNHNIHLAADLISGSIVESSGGKWSFNERVGESTADKGFLGAGSIINGELDDAVGGGICQVATTVFNSVYEAGFPILQRNNHTLYIASYPPGRDAAIAFPYMDLIWTNDSTSDVLIMCSYTDTTLTVELIGVDPNYSVSTLEGEWEEGEKYKTKTVKDDTLEPGTSRVDTVGRDGQRITVVRTVTDSKGNVIREDTFNSEYDPVTEVVTVGPEVEKKPSGETQDDTEA